jgi:1-deoxy-D-xylulose-5-phosphate synthase
MRNVPNMIVAAPMDEVELRNLMYTAQLRRHKAAIFNPLSQGMRKCSQLASDIQ